MNRIVVSVIVPCYNQAIYLSEALDSVVSQTFPDWECIIVDDGSPDDTAAIAQEYCSKDVRFKYLRKINGGLSSARNAGVKASSGDYILPLDADDKIDKHYLELATAVYAKNAAVKVVYGEAAFFGSKTGPWHLPAYSLRSLALKNLIYCSAVFKRIDYDRCGGYDESFLGGREDWDFWLTLLQDGGEVVRLPQVLFFYRQKQVSMLNDLLKDDPALIESSYKMYNKHKTLYDNLFGDPITAFREKEKVENDLSAIKQSRLYRYGNLLRTKMKRMFGIV